MYEIPNDLYPCDVSDLVIRVQQASSYLLAASEGCARRNRSDVLPTTVRIRGEMVPIICFLKFRLKLTIEFVVVPARLRRECSDDIFPCVIEDDEIVPVATCVSQTMRKLADVIARYVLAIPLVILEPHSLEIFPRSCGELCLRRLGQYADESGLCDILLIFYVE